MLQPLIYLLDDEQEMLAMLVDMLEEIGLPSLPFSDAKFFFDTVEAFPTPSLLVLDLNMPEMDGIEVMRRLASIDNPPALILVSGHDVGILHSAQKLGEAHNLEIIATISKPVHLKSFQQLINEYLETLGTANKSTGKNNKLVITKNEVENAINQSEFVLYYQPQFEISSGNLISCEALVRWQHPDIGMVFPDDFIPLIEKNGWMKLLTGHVIKTAVEQEQQWKKMGFTIPISINISSSDITSLSLPEQVSELLENNQLTPNMLKLEVTESALMGELVTSLDILTRLRLKGIGLSIDDFGTGYSSLSQLHKIPFSELKIDKSFVMAMTQDAEARAIVKTCIVLGHELNMKICAEGVETKAHLEQLRILGCDIAQGYYFSKAIPAQTLTIRLKESFKLDNS
jgi:EAL domain-containing protein (putative c-di-GMP-specific phosphodiesterase class I)/FixJ family two-component response regulator